MIRMTVGDIVESTGAALLAGYGVGLYPDLSEAAQRLVRWHRVFTPDEKNHAVYQQMYATWQKVYAAQLALSDAGVTNYMWKAPGI